MLLNLVDSLRRVISHQDSLLARGPATQPVSHEPTGFVLWTVLPNLLLVLITAYYAWQTRATVKEMREARGTQVLPKLIPTFEIAGPVVMFPRVVNIGPGSATEIDCKLKLEPGGPEWPWRWSLLAPGDGQSFTPRGNHPDGTPFEPYTEQIKKHYTHLSLSGSYKDATGRKHATSEIAEIRETLELTQSVGVHWSPEPIEKIEKHLEKVAKEGEALRAAIERRGDTKT
jgi:heme/copper-type cytochrome/quinol oxidase subunit 2